MRANTPIGQRPTSSIYAIKPRFVELLEPLRVRLTRRGVSPTKVTLAAIPTEFAVAACLVLGARMPIVLLAVPPLTLVWMGLNALDGSLARSNGTSSASGAALNELVDRLGDLVVVGTVFVLAPIPISAAVAVGVLGSELVALIGWATTGLRRFDGPMGKPDRAATLAVGVTLAVLWGPALTIAFAVIGMGSFAAIAVRTKTVMRLAGVADGVGVP